MQQLMACQQIHSCSRDENFQQMPDFFQSPAPQVALAAGHAPSEMHSASRILKTTFGRGEHLIHHETQGGVCNLSVVAPTLTFSQSKITAAFLEYNLSVFVKFKGSQRSVC